MSVPAGFIAAQMKLARPGNEMPSRPRTGTFKHNTKTGAKEYTSGCGVKSTGHKAYMQERAAKEERKKHEKNKKCVLTSRSEGQCAVQQPAKTRQGGGILCLSDQFPENILPLDIDRWVPQCVSENYGKAGVTHLFNWQAKCLAVDECSPLKGGNLVYSAPTSGGKTLVAELLAMQHILKERKVLFILPYVSIVTEKIRYFRQVWESLDLSILGFFCNTQGSSKGETASDTSAFHDCNVGICTMEKANVILNQLLKNGKLDELGMIVIDEIHMFSDSQRGYLLEVMLSKVLYKTHLNSRASDQNNNNENEAPNGGLPRRSNSTGRTQIVGLSATMPNIQDLSKWFGGSMYIATERPVKLTEQVFLAGTGELYTPVSEKGTDVLQEPAGAAAELQQKLPQQLQKEVPRKGPTAASTALSQGFCKVRTIEKRPSSEKDQDTDGFLGLCADSLKDGHSVLLFCPKKDWCKTSVSRLTRALEIIVEKQKRRQRVTLMRGGEGTQAAKRLLAQKDLLARRKILIAELMEASHGEMCPAMRCAVLQGCAYHHAGLTHEERQIVEDGFRAGVIKFLAATTTLAAGVNLPVRRVIVRSPIVYNRQPLKKSDYLQMSGRAGRKGQDDSGESIIFASNLSEFKASCELVTKPLLPLKSCLPDDLEAFKKMLLDAFSCGLVDSWESCKEFVSFTLCAQQTKTEAAIGGMCEIALREMQKSEFLKTVNRHTSEGSNLNKFTVPTSLGVAACESGLSPRAALQVFNDASAARKGLSLDTNLHIVFLLTPAYQNNEEPRWDVYLSQITNFEFEERMQKILMRIGITSQFINRVRHNRRACEKEDPTKFMLHKRFYTALILHNLVEEVPLQTIMDTYQLDKGRLEGLRNQAAIFCGMAVSFMRRLNYTNLADLLEPYESRLCFGVVSGTIVFVSFDDTNDSTLVYRLTLIFTQWLYLVFLE
jgi:DNA polymerase theta